MTCLLGDPGEFVYASLWAYAAADYAASIRQQIPGLPNTTWTACSQPNWKDQRAKTIVKD